MRNEPPEGTETWKKNDSVMVQRHGFAFMGAAALLLLVGLLFVMQRVLEPKYTGSVIEGNLTEEYYRDPTAHELLILGNCEAYENISPITLWNEYGISSAIRGNSSQLIAQSYYLLRDALRYETPKAVLLNVQAMTADGQDTEEYNRMVFDGMRWSRDKLDAIMAAKKSGEHLIDYVFPILRYHSRWQELSEDDFVYAFREKPLTSFNGYYLRADVRPYTEFPAERRKPDYTFPAENTDYLSRIADLCEERGIRLILMKAPSLYPEWPEPYEEQVQAFAGERGLLYWNTLALADEIGLDFAADTYDEGLHLNVYGAEKLSAWLGRRLTETCGLTDQRGSADPKTVSWYTERSRAYQTEKERQEREFAATGRVTIGLR